MKFTDTLTEYNYNQHQLWLMDNNTGNKLNLSGANLRGANLIDANLSGANISDANLSCADLIGANLSDVDLSGAYLRRAYLIRADLSGATLSGADLIGADLIAANLSNTKINNTIGNNTIGNKKEIKTLQLSPYTVTICNDVMAIGCKQYTIPEWYNFTDDTIAAMDINALSWWTANKEFIKAYIDK